MADEQHPEPAIVTPQPRWFQFSLRTIFVFFVVTAVLLATLDGPGAAMRARGLIGRSEGMELVEVLGATGAMVAIGAMVPLIPLFGLTSPPARPKPSPLPPAQRRPVPPG